MQSLRITFVILGLLLLCLISRETTIARQKSYSKIRGNFPITEVLILRLLLLLLSVSEQEGRCAIVRIIFRFR